MNAIHPSHKMHSHTYQPAEGWWARSCRFCHAEERWTLGRSQVRTTAAIREPCKAAPDHSHLCPVCSMPKPDGLAHCSLKCEEADPLPQPGEETPAERIAYLKTQVEGITVSLKRPGIDNTERMMLHADRADLRREIDRLEFPAPVEGASDARD